MPAPPLHIWIFSDAKPGHVNQTRALAESVRRRRSAVIHELDTTHASPFTGRLPSKATRALPSPDLILCAGRRTHRPARAAKRQHKAPLVCCMRPPSHTQAYDLCLIPRHDAPPQRENVEPTTGAIVNVRPSQDHDSSRGVILIGGASKHCDVDTEALIAAVQEITSRDSHVLWQLTTSRRTPADLRNSLLAFDHDNLRVIPAERTTQGWVGERLASAGRAWVTEDSVSMLCEAVTSGCATGVLPMKRLKPDSRVLRCVDDFTRELRYATPLSAWRNGAELAAPAHTLDEADRCAGIIVSRFYANNGAES